MVKEEIKTYLKARDPILTPLIDKIELPELMVGDVYENLLSSIVSQQLSVKAAATIYNRFLDLFPNRYPDPENVLAISKETLRAVGLSAQKAAYIQNTAIYFHHNVENIVHWQDLSDKEIIDLLSCIKGVGIWTVQMILIFTLRREDVFPHLDLGVKTGMKRLYGIESESKLLQKNMEEIAENWRPYRSYVARYIWHWKDTD